MRNQFILYSLLLLSTFCFSQRNRYNIPYFNIISFSGNLQLHGGYTFTESNDSKSNSNMYRGGLTLNTTSYIYHPNLVTLSLSGTYGPSFGNNERSHFPATFSKNYNTGYDLRALFFKRLKTNFSIFMSHNEFYNNNNDFSINKSRIKRHGGTIHHRSDILTARLEVERRDEVNEDLINNTEYRLLRTSYEGVLSTSFYKIDSNELTVLIDDYTSELINIYKQSQLSRNVLFASFIPFGKEDRARLHSRFNLRDSEIKDAAGYTSMGVNENFLYNISKRLYFHSDFGYDRSKQSLQLTETTSYSAGLQHTLYESLNTNLYVNHTYSKSYGNSKLSDFSRGIGLSYTKKVPFLNGDIRLNFGYNVSDKNRMGSENEQAIYNEQHILSDGTIILLNNPDIIMESIIVKNESGDFIYQENIDYILIQQGEYIEIQRLVGGNIENDTMVYIDYVTTINETYSYQQSGTHFSSNLSIAKNLISFYYRTNTNDFSSNEDISFLSLDNSTKNNFGSIFNYKKLRAEVSYENNNSSLIQYKVWRYSLLFNGNLTRRLGFSLSGNYYSYSEYFNEDSLNSQLSISSNLSYRPTYDSNLSINTNYFERNFFGQNNKTIIVNSSYRKRWSQLTFELNISLYNNKSSENTNKYLGTFVLISRTF